MTLPLLRILKAGPPPPKVVLLPDGLFFTRSIAIAPGSSAADVAGQVELALETLSPFPAAQLYHGFYWPPGADRALVFAAYRRRFTNEQLAGWDTAELVMPSFAALLGGDNRTNSTVVIPSEEGLTALYFEQSPVPSRIVFRAIQPDASEADRTRAQEQLANAVAGNRAIVLKQAPVVAPSASDRDLAFRAEAFNSRIPAAQAGALDVRDKTALADLRRARSRDLALWRGFLGLIGVLFLLVLGEVGLIVSGVWQKGRLAQLNQQRPVGERVMMAQNVTTRINDLSTKRLLPFEMILQVMGPKPASVRFVRAQTVGLYGLNVEAESTSPAAPSAYQSALSGLPSIEKVEVREQRARDNLMTFTLAVTFRPETVKAGSAP